MDASLLQQEYPTDLKDPPHDKTIGPRNQITMHDGPLGCLLPSVPRVIRLRWVRRDGERRLVLRPQ
jgi:hypothetical protein